jgi:alpha-beta hydrolase superfamily lysophospholipase
VLLWRHTTTSTEEKDLSTRTGFLEAHDGTQLLTRHWEASNPRATMLIVHGISEHTGRWEHVGDYFAGHGFDVHGIDLRGHGESGGAKIHVDDFGHYLDDVALMMEGLAALGRPTVMYGHSMGGLICTAYEVESRLPKPDAVVLSAPALDADAPAVLRVAAKVVGRIAPGFRLSSNIKGEQLSVDPAVGEAYFADPLVSVKATAAMGRELFAAMERTRNALHLYDVPTLVIHGTHDTLVPPAASAPLAAVARVDRRLFPEFRHELHNEPEADEVLAHILDWLSEQLAG